MEEKNEVVQPDGSVKKQLPIKQILIGVAIVAILVIGYFGVSKIFKNSDEDTSYLEILDQDKLIPIEEKDFKYLKNIKKETKINLELEYSNQYKQKHIFKQLNINLLRLFQHYVLSANILLRKL